MSFNPFEQKPIKIDKTYEDWGRNYPKSYDKGNTAAYTKVRNILMNGTEYEATWFLHNFHRHTNNNDLRRELAQVRRSEQLQQKKVSCLKPKNETVLENTIGYEQLAVDLTAILGKREVCTYTKQALDFALLEDFDHLYRFANLLEMEHKIDVSKMVQQTVEIMPGRPTISEYRYPYDDVKRPGNAKAADIITKLDQLIITAAEQQTMNYYMNQSAFYTTDIGRKMFAQIGMIEEQHVTHYGALQDPTQTWLEMWLMHEYTECYLYYSMMEDETDQYIKQIYAEFLDYEIAHLHIAANNLKRYEKKDWQQCIPNGAFPVLIKFGPQKEYVRQVLKNTVKVTAKKEDYCDVNDLPDDYEFFKYQKRINKNLKDVATHTAIEKHIKKFGEDFRYQANPHPCMELSDRKIDNTDLGRTKNVK